MRPLTTGTALSASTQALTKNDIKPSFTPFFFVNSCCLLRRNSCTALMSHSLNVVRIAAVCCAITSCCPILRRNGDIFLRTKRPSPDGCTSRVSIFSPALPRSCTTASTSSFVRRPPSPVPRIFSASSFSSSTMRRTAGESVVVPMSRDDSGPLRSTAAATGSFFSVGFFDGSASFLCSGAFFDGASFFCSAGCFESSIVATTSPIFTSCPSGTFVSRVPAFSATISVETLSVSSVKSGSPSLTKSPDFLCQAETTPLVIDSPTAGIFTSMTMRENYPASAGLIERRVRDRLRQQTACLARAALL